MGIWPSHAIWDFEQKVLKETVNSPISDSE